jgi:hypothetical protein
LEALFIKIVKSGDKIRARQYAAQELSMRYSPEIVDALLEAANKEPEQVQYSSITALGRIGEQLPVEDKHIIIELIIKIMRSAQDKRVRDATVNALGRTGSEQVLPYLREALKDSDLFVGATAASYLGRLGNFEDIAAIEEYLSRTQNDGQKNTAENAIKTLRRRVEFEY